MDPEELFALMHQELRASTHQLLETVRKLHCEDDRAIIWSTWLAWNQFLKEYFQKILVREQEGIRGSRLTPLKWSWWRWSVLWLLPLCIRLAVWWWGLRYVLRKWTALCRWRHLRTAMHQYVSKEPYASARELHYSFCLRPLPHTREWSKLPYSREKKTDRCACREGAEVPLSRRVVHSPLSIRNRKKMDERVGAPRRRKSNMRSSSYFQCRLRIGWILFFFACLCFISILFLYPLFEQLLHSLIGFLPISPSWHIALESVFFYPTAYPDVSVTGGEREGGVERGNVDSRIRLPFTFFSSLWLPYKHGYYRFLRAIHQCFSFVLTEKYVYIIIPVFITLVHQSILQVSALVDAITLYGYSRTALMAERALEMEEEAVAVCEQ